MRAWEVAAPSEPADVLPLVELDVAAPVRQRRRHACPEVEDELRASLPMCPANPSLCS